MQDTENNISMYTRDEQFYFNFHHARYKKTISLLKTYCPHGTILDVGAYPFQLSNYFQQDKNYKILGLDSKPERKQALIKKLNLDIRKCNIEKDSFPIQDSSIDVALLCEVFEHLGQNPLFTLQEIHKILKKDGHLIITTPNFYSLKNVIRIIVGRSFNNPYIQYQKVQKYGHMGHIREYSRYEMKLLLSNTNYKILYTKFERYNTSEQNKIIYSIYTLFLYIFPFFKPSQTIVCQKI